jgi:hypothetical protein
MSGKRTLGTALGGTLAVIALALPQSASGGVLNDVVGDVQDTVNNTVSGVLGSAGGSGAAPAPAPPPVAAPTPQASGPTTEPPLSSGLPHGSGTVLDTDVDNPLIQDLGVTIGQSEGSQDSDGDYHGVVKVISVTGLGNPVELAIETDEGETANGPLTPINDALDDLCTASSICLNVLDYDSETTGNGSQNSFSAASASVGGAGLLVPIEAVSAGVLTSEGNISEDTQCQTASGNSSAADVGVLGGAINAEALNSESESQACRNGNESATADSEVVQLNQVGLLGVLGCDEEQVDATFPPAPLNAVIDGVCNGDDTNGSQADAPYNVRKALGLEALPAVLPIVGVGVDLDAADSQSLAVAPEGEGPPECPDPANPDCDGPTPPECPDPSNPECDEGPPRGPGPGPGPDGPSGPSADSPESLPFTGADIGVLGLVGAIVMVGGLGLMALADRRRKANG